MFFTKKEKINVAELKTMFDSQKKVLLEKGYGDLVGQEIFEKETQTAWQELEKNAPTISFVKHGNLPLLLVTNIKDLKQGIEKLHGHTELDISNIKANLPEKLFYILLDVENGHDMMAKSTEYALKKFIKQERHALTINESMALLTFYPDILKDHYVISAGSFFIKDGKELPLLWLHNEDHNPELHYAWRDIAHGSYGIASYAVKI